MRTYWQRSQRLLAVTAMLVLGVVGTAGIAAADPGNGNGSGSGSGNGNGSSQAATHPSSGNAGTSGDVTSPQPRSNADNTGNGANQSGPYDSTRDGSPSGNGSGNGNATGEPCAGCVGKADNKNPARQLPGPSDANAGYECDSNHGIGQSNPAHTGCTEGPVTPPVTPPVIPPVTPPVTPPTLTPPTTDTGVAAFTAEAPNGATPAAAALVPASSASASGLARTGFSALSIGLVALVSLAGGLALFATTRARLNLAVRQPQPVVPPPG